MKHYRSPKEAVKQTQLDLIYQGSKIETEWQGIIKERHKMQEILSVSFDSPMPYGVEVLQKELDPDLPWAENHFRERISGIPSNPGEQYRNWPYYIKKDDEWRKHNEGEFSHTYQERMNTPELMGIRFKYGNLQDVIDLLNRRPDTRQGFLPIWFPEDTGAKKAQRVPCSLGYHFIIRRGILYVTYYIRSCDAIRHFKNDLYMAIRLAHHVRNKTKTPYLGLLTFHCVSFHCFESDLYTLKKITNYENSN